MSGYPTGYDSFAQHADSDGTTREVIHAQDINDLGDAIAAIEAEMGLAPKAAYATLADRIDAIALAANRATSASFTQAIPSALWDITHTLGGYPSVTIVDSAGSIVIGDVTYFPAGRITIEFCAPFAGDVHLS